MEPLKIAKRQRAPEFAASGSSGHITLQDYSYRQDLLLVLLHGPLCPECTRIAEGLEAHRSDWEGWGTALLVLHSEPEAFPPSLRQGHDAGGEIRRIYADGEADVAFIFIETRGSVMDGWSLRHPEPVNWREVAETARWMAMQEPECGACEVLPGWE